MNKKKGTVIKPRGRKRIGQTLLSLGRHIVYSEGTVTEPSYLENVKEHLKFYLDRQNTIIIDHMRETKNTLELFKYAQKDVIERRKNGEQIDYVWIFFDKDHFPNFDQTCRSIEKMNDHGHNYQGDSCDDKQTCWVPCWSNACFELWILLHFCLFQSRLGSCDYAEKINEQIKRHGHQRLYDKTLPNLYDFLLSVGGDVEKAIKHARYLINQSANSTKWGEPSTGVYRFAEYFLRYLQRAADVNAKN